MTVRTPAPKAVTVINSWALQHWLSLVLARVKH
jgi:hypothetical protein